MMTENDFLRKLRGHVAMNYKTATMAADSWGVSSAYVSQVMNGSKAPNQTILNEMGFIRSREVSVIYSETNSQ